MSSSTASDSFRTGLVTHRSRTPYSHLHAMLGVEQGGHHIRAVVASARRPCRVILMCPSWIASNGGEPQCSSCPPQQLSSFAPLFSSSLP